jgi:cytochrome c553
MACHGLKGEGNANIGAPNIAGMDAVYVTRQLNHFAAGVRGAAPNDGYGAQMRAAASLLKTDADRQAMAGYIAALAKVPSRVAYKGAINNGSTQYNAVCSSCHEARAQGNQQMGAPALIGLDPNYMERQIMAFREGRRGAHPDDKQGALMKVGASMLPDTQSVHDVIAYILTLNLK